MIFFVNVDLWAQLSNILDWRVVWGFSCTSFLDNPMQISIIGRQTSFLSHSNNVSAFGLTLEHSCCDCWHRLQFGNLVTRDNF